MKNSQNKHISSFNNPEYKFLISLRKNRNRKSEMKSIAEGYRENNQLIDSRFDIDNRINIKYVLICLQPKRTIKNHY